MLEKFNLTTEKSDFGHIYYYAGDECRFALYQYNDDKSSIYLSNVFVNESNRKCGVGTKILDYAQAEAKRLNTNTIFLKVIENSWVHNLYKNYGYTDFCEDKDFVWMKKSV